MWPVDSNRRYTNADFLATNCNSFELPVLYYIWISGAPPSPFFRVLGLSQRDMRLWCSEVDLNGAPTYSSFPFESTVAVATRGLGARDAINRSAVPLRIHDCDMIQ